MNAIKLIDVLQYTANNIFWFSKSDYITLFINWETDHDTQFFILQW